MRNIKFRGKSLVDIGTIKSGDWLYGGIAFDADRVWIDIPYIGQALADKETIGQYTGLKDKNGQEIYEGDVVLYKDWEIAYEGGGNDSFINKGMVEYCEDNCCFNVTERQTIDISDVLYKDNEDLEVIGNIYDNPEL